jgi:hypothetical protein
MRRITVKNDLGRIRKGTCNVKVWVAILLAASILTGMAGIVEAQQKKSFNFLALPAGTSVYTIAVGQGLILNKKLPDYKFFVQPSSRRPRGTISDRKEGGRLNDVALAHRILGLQSGKTIPLLYHRFAFCKAVMMSSSDWLPD